MRDGFGDQAIAFESIDRASILRGAEPGDRHGERGPLQPVRPGGRARVPSGGADRGTANAERFADRRLAHLPDEPVVVEVEQRRGGQQTGQRSADGLIGDRRGQEVQRAVRSDQPDV